MLLITGGAAVEETNFMQNIVVNSIWLIKYSWRKGFFHSDKIYWYLFWYGYQRVLHVYVITEVLWTCFHLWKWLINTVLYISIWHDVLKPPYALVLVWGYDHFGSGTRGGLELGFGELIAFTLAVPSTFRTMGIYYIRVFVNASVWAMYIVEILPFEWFISLIFFVHHQFNLAPIPIYIAVSL